MAVVSVIETDTTPTIRRWEMPAGPQGLRSPVPRGILCFNGTQAYAAKITTNQTNIRVVLNFPTGYVYLAKSLLLRIVSDDLVNDFNLVGGGNYVLAALSQNPHFNMECPGEVIVGLATQAAKIYGPTQYSSPKYFINQNDAMGFNFADMSADASTAGDFIWNMEFFQYDVDQIDKFELNTPIPIVTSTSF